GELPARFTHHPGEGVVVRQVEVAARGHRLREAVAGVEMGEPLECPGAVILAHLTDPLVVPVSVDDAVVGCEESVLGLHLTTKLHRPAGDHNHGSSNDEKSHHGLLLLGKSIDYVPDSRWRSLRDNNPPDTRRQTAWNGSGGRQPQAEL